MTSFSEPFRLHDIPSQDDKNITLKVDKEEKPKSFSPVFSFLFFGPPHNKIVSCSFDRTIRTWNLEATENLETVNQKSELLDLIKLNGEVFLVCSVYGNVRSFSISSLAQEKEFMISEEGDFFAGLLRLSDDLFIGRAYNGELYLWSYEKAKILKKYYAGKLLKQLYRPLLLSQKYPQCFYVATNDEHETIKLVNYERDEVVKEFKFHDTNRRFYCLSLFHNSKNEEILFAPHTSRKIYTYNTSHPQFNTRIKINEIKKWENVEPFQCPNDHIRCSFSFNNQYLLTGDRSGILHFYELQEAQGTIKNIKERKIHNGEIRDLLFLPDRKILLTSSNDSKIKATRVGGFPLKTNFDVLDQKERFEFLLEYMKSESQFFFKVLILQLGDPVEIVVPKTLFV